MTRYIRHSTPYIANSDTPLLTLGGQPWTARHTFEATMVCGGVGSGKSSSSGRAISKAFLRAGYGGLVLTVKSSERERWQQYARECGREHNLLIVDSSATHRINWLDYALATIASNGFEQNLVPLIMQMADAASVADAAGGGSDNPFFRKAAEETLAHAVGIIHAAEGTVDLRTLYDFITTAPTTREEADSQSWQQQSRFADIMIRAAHKAKDEGNAYAGRMLDEHGDYWLAQFPRLGDRTRSSIIATLTSVFYPFLSGALRTLFGTDTTFVPELCREGAIIILDLPVNAYGKAALIAQQTIKYLWQLAMQRIAPNKRTRPCFLFVDEYQHFASMIDIEAVATAREARVASVFITQDIPTLQSSFAAINPHAAHALLSKAQTRIFHATTDPETAKYAAELTGKWERFNHSKSISHSRNSGSSTNQGERAGAYGGGHGRSLSVTESVSSYQDDALRPEYFANRLRTGGPANKFRADAIVIRNSQRFASTGRNFAKVEFDQKC